MKVTKADEGVYRCEARVEARGEIDFRDIVVLVNGKPGFSLDSPTAPHHVHFSLSDTVAYRLEPNQRLLFTAAE